MEFEGPIGIVIAVVRQNIEERPDEIEAFAGDVGNLENGTYSLADELGSSLNGFIAVLDEDGDFPGAWRLEDAGQLSYGLLENLRWADVDFGDHHHDWHIECECDSKVLPEGIYQLLLMHECEWSGALTCSCRSVHCSQPP